MSSLPKSLGRYQVLGQLATGGMAEILLGRLLGPNGFERPVVLKRVLPHLARQDGFVAMFLDEARIVAGIRHPAVVHVHELCRVDGELFMVMEFLEGESLAGLQKRLLLRSAKLDWALAATIIAEACAGLHAAHELTDRDGAKQELVHRDVSPQNLFVTYDGHVKVIDFGIAKAVDRVTRTETGYIKGKFEYMSPEQCKNLPLDRRSDIFALGIVLYELTLGRRLFKRSSPAETIAAIGNEPPVPPSRIDADYPLALERIGLKALAARPGDRYPTAAAMRRDLLAVAHELAGGKDATENLAELMQRHFEDRITEKRELLRKVVSGAEVEDVPVGEVDDGVEIPTMPLELMAGTGGRAALASEIVASTTRRRGASLGAIVVLVTMAAAGGVVAWRARPAVIASNHVAVDVTPAHSADSVRPASTEITLHIDTVPPGASVAVAGQERAISPYDVRLPRATQSVSVNVEQPGYARLVQNVVPDSDQKLVLVLEPLPSAAAPPRARPRSRPTGAPAPRASSTPDSAWEKWH